MVRRFTTAPSTASSTPQTRRTVTCRSKCATAGSPPCSTLRQRHRAAARRHPIAFTLGASGDQYLLSATGPEQTVAAGATAQFSESLYVGPKLQGQLEATAPELGRVADYGRLWFLSMPLFWVLDKVHGLTSNWGVAIILVTFLLKLVFYPLSEASGRSMAKMKALQPRIKNLQETYKDDREEARPRDDGALSAREDQPGRRLPADRDPDPGVSGVLLGAARERRDAPGAVRVLDPRSVLARPAVHPPGDHGGGHVRAVQV